MVASVNEYPFTGRRRYVQYTCNFQDQQYSELAGMLDLPHEAIALPPQHRLVECQF